METNIFLTSAIDQEIRSKINYKPIQELLKDIVLSEYGDVTGINFFFICMDELNKKHKNKVKYDQEHKHINVFRILDFDAVQIMNEEQIYEYMITKFISSIKKYKKLKADFDYKRFKEDIESVLLSLEEV